MARQGSGSRPFAELEEMVKGHAVIYIRGSRHGRIGPDEFNIEFYTADRNTFLKWYKLLRDTGARPNISDKEGMFRLRLFSIEDVIRVLHSVDWIVPEKQDKIDMIHDSICEYNLSGELLQWLRSVDAKRKSQ